MSTPVNINEFSKSPKQQSALKTIFQGGNPADENVQISRRPDLNVGQAPPDVEPGDKWKDRKGNIWEQKKGYKINHGKTYGKTRGVPLLCPECETVMTHRLDSKMYKIHGMCFDCVITFEDEIRKAGKWDLYEKQRVAANMKSWIRDQKSQFQEFLKAGDREEYVKDEFGNVETWTADIDLDQLKSDFNEYISIYQSKLEAIESEIEELKEKGS